MLLFDHTASQPNLYIFTFKTNFINVIFISFRIAASHLMVEVSLIMMVNLIVSSITMPKEVPFVLDAISLLVGDVLLLCLANFTPNILCALFAWNNLTKVLSKNRTTSLTAIPALKSFLPEEFLTLFFCLHQPIASFLSGNFITSMVFKRICQTLLLDKRKKYPRL